MMSPSPTPQLRHDHQEGEVRLMIGKGRAVMAATVRTSTVMPDQCGALWSEVTAVFRKFVKNPPLNLGTSDILTAY